MDATAILNTMSPIGEVLRFLQFLLSFSLTLISLAFVSSVSPTTPKITTDVLQKVHMI